MNMCSTICFGRSGAVSKFYSGMYNAGYGEIEHSTAVFIVGGPVLYEHCTEVSIVEGSV